MTEIWKNQRTDENFCRFRLLRNKATQSVRLAKRRFYSRKFHSVLPTRKLWSSIRGLGLLAESDSATPPFTDDELNQHFTGNAYSLFPLFINVSGSPATNTSHCNGLHSAARRFSFRNVTDTETYDAIHRIKSNSEGLYCIPISFIKMVLPVVLPVITFIFNAILTKSAFPSRWKSSKVLPRHKNTRNRSLSDYRPISILLAISKALERLMKAQITDFFTEFDLLHKLQSGFRSNHSTTTALLKITNDVRVNMDKGLVTVLLLLDFSKAFDSVKHDLLLGKLSERFSFSTSALKLVEGIKGIKGIKGRNQKVVVNGVSSPFLDVTLGLPQGSILGPLLFSAFINDLPSVVKFSRFHLFAEDV